MNSGSYYIVCALIMTGCASGGESVSGSTTLDTVESKVYQADASKKVFMERGEACIDSLVRNDAVMLNKGTGSFLGNAGAILGGTASYSGDETIQGGRVIAKVQPDKGIILANSRIDFAKNLISYNVQSRIRLEVKEGRFRITHEHILEAMKSSSGSRGYGKVAERWGTGWEKTEAELIKLSDNIATCMSKPIVRSTW